MILWAILRWIYEGHIFFCFPCGMHSLLKEGIITVSLTVKQMALQLGSLFDSGLRCGTGGKVEG